jgi:hypothetical protein
VGRAARAWAELARRWDGEGLVIGQLRTIASGTPHAERGVPTRARGLDHDNHEKDTRT